MSDDPIFGKVNSPGYQRMLDEQAAIEAAKKHQTSSLFASFAKHRRLIISISVILAILIVGFLLQFVLPSSLTGALFQTGAGTNPNNSVFISRLYQAQPNERGSVVLEAGETLTNFEGLFLTLSIDAATVDIVRTLRTALTEDFDVSYTYSAPGVVRVALVGAPVTIAAGQDLLEFELQLRDSSINQLGNTIELRLIDVEVFVEGGTVLATTEQHNGKVTIISGQNALSLPLSPFLSDIDSGVQELVEGSTMTIRGAGFHIESGRTPVVLFGNTPVSVLSASSTEIRVLVPDLIGRHSISVDSLLAEEEVVILEAEGPSGAVDILDEFLFISPNPVQFGGGTSDAEIVVHIPVFNPLGSDKAIRGSVDFSALDGNPNIVFGRQDGVSDSECDADPLCSGTSAQGPGGTTILWFQVPFSLPESVGTNADYPITVRAENTAQSRDTAVEILNVRSIVSQGGEPTIGVIKTDPAVTTAGSSVRLSADITDLEGVSTIDQVLLDLSNLRNGTAIQMEPPEGIELSEGLQTLKFFATFQVSSSEEVGPKELTVTAIDEDGNTAEKTVTLQVSTAGGGGTAAGAPVILDTFVSPPQAPADDDTNVEFYAIIEDEDSIEDIDVVTIRLDQLHLGVESMDLESDTVGEASRTGTFKTDRLQIPQTVASQTYQLPITVQDKKGNITTGTVAFTVGVQAIQGDAPLISESRFVPESISPGEEGRLFVEINDANCTDDIVVTADLTEIELDFEELDDVVNFPSGVCLKKQTFESDRFTVPRDLREGIYDVPVSAIDESNNLVETTVRLRVERGGADDGQEPRIQVGQSFQSPRVFVNDDNDINELHVLVTDPDDDVLTVTANFGSVARARGVDVDEQDSGLELFCNESLAVACMQKSVLDDTGARWFVLEDIAVPETTQSRNEPYFIKLTAIDEEGHITSVEMPISIGGPETFTAFTESPELVTVVPVGVDKMEVVLSTPLDTSSVDRSGAQFRIQPVLDAFTTFNVRRVSWDPTGTFLYLETQALQPGTVYRLSVVTDDPTIPPLTNVYGNRFAAEKGGSITFTGFAPPGTPPEIQSVHVADKEHIDVRFTTQVLPSSVHPHVLPFSAQLSSIVTGDAVRILGGEMRENGYTLRLQTAELREGDRYELIIKDVLGPGLVSVPLEGLRKIFTAVFPSRHGAAGPLILPTADLNKDGHVDFADFALFSSVYNTEYDLSDVADLADRLRSPDADSSEEDEERHEAAPPRPRGEPLGGELPDLEY